MSRKTVGILACSGAMVLSVVVPIVLLKRPERVKIIKVPKRGFEVDWISRLYRLTCLAIVVSKMVRAA